MLRHQLLLAALDLAEGKTADQQQQDYGNTGQDDNGVGQVSARNQAGNPESGFDWDTWGW